MRIGEYSKSIVSASGREFPGQEACICSRVGINVMGWTDKLRAVRAGKLAYDIIDQHSLTMATTEPLVFRWGIISTGNIATAFVKVCIVYFLAAWLSSF